MAGNRYAKFWTSMLTDDWFVSLSCTQRGFWMQLILLAKSWGDTGTITIRSRAAIGQLSGLDAASAGKYLRLFLEQGKITIEERKGKFLTIRLENYHKWQRFSAINNRKNTPENHEDEREKSASNQTEPDRTEQKYKEVGVRLIEVMDYYNKKVGRNWSLTTKRRQMLRKRLETFSVDDCKLAIDGIWSRPYNRGDNESRTVYLDFELIFRSDEQVEKYMTPVKGNADPLEVCREDD